MLRFTTQHSYLVHVLQYARAVRASFLELCYHSLAILFDSSRHLFCVPLEERSESFLCEFLVGAVLVELVVSGRL